MITSEDISISLVSSDIRLGFFFLRSTYANLMSHFKVFAQLAFLVATGYETRKQIRRSRTTETACLISYPVPPYVVLQFHMPGTGVSAC